MVPFGGPHNDFQLVFYSFSVTMFLSQPFVSYYQLLKKKIKSRDTEPFGNTNIHATVLVDVNSHTKLVSHSFFHSKNVTGNRKISKRVTRPRPQPFWGWFVVHKLSLTKSKIFRCTQTTDNHLQFSSLITNALYFTNRSRAPVCHGDCTIHRRRQSRSAVVTDRLTTQTDRETDGETEKLLAGCSLRRLASFPCVSFYTLCTRQALIQKVAGWSRAGLLARDRVPIEMSSPNKAWSRSPAESHFSIFKLIYYCHRCKKRSNKNLKNVKKRF